MLATDTLPWYRQGWPWFLIAVPATSVVLGILMIALALHTDDPLVVDDYYKAGKAINRTLARDVEAARHGLVARVRMDADDTLALELAHASTAAAGPFDHPDALELRWVHATRAELDGQALLGHLGGGRYASPATTLPTDGRWRLHVEPAADARPWRLVSDPLALVPADTPVTIRAAAPRSGR